MSTPRNLPIILALVFEIFGTRAFGQTGTSTDCTPTIPSLTKIVADTSAKDPSERAVLGAIDKAIGSGTATSNFLFVGTQANLIVSVQGPARAYRFAISEALRRRDPAAGISVPSVVTIQVQPRTIDAPNRDTPSKACPS
jgi:hypothetical protein